jgi:hypothetical protein
MTSVFCGIGWATDHHDVALLDEADTLLGKLRIDDTPAGHPAPRPARPAQRQPTAPDPDRHRDLPCLHHCLTHHIPYDEQTAFPNTA